MVAGLSFLLMGCVHWTYSDWLRQPESIAPMLAYCHARPVAKQGRWAADCRHAARAADHLSVLFKTLQADEFAFGRHLLHLQMALADSRAHLAAARANNRPTDQLQRRVAADELAVASRLALLRMVEHQNML
jgi:hypothetical protein